MTFSVIDISVDVNKKEILVKNHSDRYTCLMVSIVLQTIILFCGDSIYSETKDGETFIRFTDILEFSNALVSIATLGDELPDKFNIHYKEEQTNEESKIN